MSVRYTEPTPRGFPGSGCCADPSVEFEGPDDSGKAGDCVRPNRMGCRRCGAVGFVRCNSSRRSKCAPCAKRHQRRVQMVVQHGLWKAGDGQGLLVTVTAPGDRLHCRRHQRCSAEGPDCEVCPCTPEGGVDIAEFNATFTARLNRVLTAIRRGEASPRSRGRRVRRGAGWAVVRRNVPVPLAYFSGREVQDGKRRSDGVGRMALHAHIPMWRDDGKRLLLSRDRLRALLMKHGFGHSLDMKRIATRSGGDGEAFTKVGFYVAKYVVDAADLRYVVPWRGPDGVLRHRAAYRPWSSSRNWGQTMAGVKEQQRASFTAVVPPEAPQAPQGRTTALDVFSVSYASIGALMAKFPELLALERLFVDQTVTHPPPWRIWRVPGENQLSLW